MTSFIQQLSAGRTRSIVLTRDGRAYAYGAVKPRNLGLDPAMRAHVCRSDPSQVGHFRYAQPHARQLNPGRPFLHVADGPAQPWAVARSGAVLSCQPAADAQGGAQLTELAGLPGDVVALCAGEVRSLALCVSGQVWGWGLRRGAPGMDAPTRLTGLPAVAQLAMGRDHALALGRDGAVWAWGTNGAGQLGAGDLRPRALPQRVDIDAPIVSLAAGDTHSLAVDDRGRLWAWGSNHQGQLGPRADGQTAQPYETRPVRVRLAAALAQVDGGMHFSAARTRDGEVLTWGWNGMGQLGRPAQGATPARVPGLAGVAQLACGQGHVLAVAGEHVLAWGDNHSAACGQPSSEPIVPTPVALAWGDLAAVTA